MATLKEKREKLQERIAKLQAREKALAQKDKVKERKERTKRLIELGAIVESKFSKEAVFALRWLTKDELTNVEKFLLRDDAQNVAKNHETADMEKQKEKQQEKKNAKATELKQEQEQPQNASQP